MYGESVQEHITHLRSGLDALADILRQLEREISPDVCLDAEFAAVSLHDQLRDIAIWLHGARVGIAENTDRVRRGKD